MSQPTALDANTTMTQPKKIQPTTSHPKTKVDPNTRTSTKPTTTERNHTTKAEATDQDAQTIAGSPSGNLRAESRPKGARTA
jgi:hypothetical protein